MKEWLQKNWIWVVIGLGALMGLIMIARSRQQQSTGGVLVPISPNPDAVLQADTQKAQIAAQAQHDLLTAQSGIIVTYLNDFFANEKAKSDASTALDLAKVNAANVSKALDVQQNENTMNYQVAQSRVAAQQQDSLLKTVGTVLGDAFHF